MQTLTTYYQPDVRPAEVLLNRSPRAHLLPDDEGDGHRGKLPLDDVVEVFETFNSHFHFHYATLYIHI